MDESSTVTVGELDAAVAQVQQTIDAELAERTRQLALFNGIESDRHALMVSMRAERDQLAAERREAHDRALTAELQLAGLLRTMKVMALNLDKALGTPEADICALLDRAARTLHGMLEGETVECPDCVEAQQKVKSLHKVMLSTAAALTAVAEMSAVPCELD